MNIESFYSYNIKFSDVPLACLVSGTTLHQSLSALLLELLQSFWKWLLPPHLASLFPKAGNHDTVLTCISCSLWVVHFLVVWLHTSYCGKHFAFLDICQHYFLGSLCFHSTFHFIISSPPHPPKVEDLYDQPFQDHCTLPKCNLSKISPFNTTRQTQRALLWNTSMMTILNLSP